MRKNHKILITASWFFLVLVLLLFPMPEYQGDVITYYDKVVHMILFGVFCFLLSWTLIEFFEKKANIVLASFFFASLFSFVGEYLQNFVPGRTVSEFDLLAGILGALIAVVYSSIVLTVRPKLLLHICCIGCGVYASQLLSKKYRVTLYFNNSNIYPRGEFDKRLEEINKIAKLYKYNIIKEPYDYDGWKKMAKGLEQEPERGKRCILCYRSRLEKTARYARKNKFNYFTSTLTTSPHKEAKTIMSIGQSLEAQYSVKFLSIDFKKNDGFKKAAKISKDLDLYRQNYCGCEYSIRV